ncbi:delta-60 repeat domain-containing protein [Paractinoplanes rishiriensis]|nr:delta-60 repeat domain-containing protein [Actinoplanes rishiriensis]
MKWLRRGARALSAGVFTAVVLLCVPGVARAAFIPEPTVGRVASADPSDLTPHARDGEVRAFAEVGNTVYVGGTFTQIRTGADGTWAGRPYLFAYDRLTGAVSSTFAPTLDGAVNALAVNAAGQLIVGGGFRNVNGAERRNLVALNPATGATVGSWTGRSDGGVVRTLKISDGHLYVGGAFNWLNGVERRGLARVSAATGAIDSGFVMHATAGRNNVAPYVWTLDVAPDGRTLVVGGNFTLVDGVSRNQIAVIDVAGDGAATLADWQTSRYVSPCASPNTFTHYVQDVDFSDDGSYFIVGSNGGGGWPTAYCDALVRFETGTRGTGLSATWTDFTGNDTITSVEAADEVIYTGGHFRWLNNPNRSDAAGPGAVDRLGVAAADPNNGLPINWNPRRSGAPAGTTAWGSAVPVIWRGSDGIYIGQNSDGLGNEYHGRFAMFPMSGGRTIPVVRPPAEPSGYLYSGGTAGELTRTAIADGALGAATVTAQPNFTGTGVATRAGDKLYWDVAGEFGISSVAGNGAIGAPWHVGYNDWFSTSVLTGAFYLNGRLYYTRSTGSGLYYRYFEPDGYIVGATEFSLPTTGMTWSAVRGMTWVNGALVYGSADGALRTVPFDATAAAGVAVDGANVAQLDAGPSWTSRTLFFAGS